MQTEQSKLKNPVLLKPKHEVASQLDQQMERGSDLLSQIPKTDDDLMLFWNEIKRWHSFKDIEVTA